MKKVFLFFAVAAVLAACAPKQAEQTEQTMDSVATEVVDSAAAVVECISFNSSSLRSCLFVDICIQLGVMIGYN